MHKRIKMLLSAALASALIFTTALTAFAAGSYIKYAGYTFSLTDGLASIHDYDGAEKDLFIPETIWGYPVVGIDDGAFFGREDFTDLYLQEGKRLTTIGACAFYGCTGITCAEVPSSVEVIGEAAFQSCTSLSELVFDTDKLTELPRQLCYGCTSLAEVAIPASVTTIGAYAFGGCDSLNHVEIPDSVTEIADDAFADSDSVVIYAAGGSYAIAYARAHGVSYVVTDQSPVTYLRGDADGDNRITVLDATCVQRVLVKLRKDLDGTVAMRAALVDETELSILDATAIQRYLAGFGNVHAIGESATGTPVPVS